MGNPTYDIIVKDEKIIHSIGGSVVYTSLILKNLGYNVSIIGKSDKKIKKKICKFGINTTYLYDIKRTTRFKNIYYGVNRIQYAVKGEKIFLEEIPDEIFYSEGIIIAPVLDEAEVSFTITKRKPIFMVDISGFLRNVTKKGKIVMKRNKKIINLIKQCDIFKCNIKEASLISNQANIKDICRALSVNYDGVGIITSARTGSYIFHRNKIFHIPSYKTIEIDPTGAGDIYGGAFFIKYFECKNIIDAGLFAASAASFIVEKFGIKNMPVRNQIENRYFVLKNSKNRCKNLEVS